MPIFALTQLPEKDCATTRRSALRFCDIVGTTRAELLGRLFSAKLMRMYLGLELSGALHDGKETLKHAV
jgi:hypothetical protein